jgi:hypothetical protein
MKQDIGYYQEFGDSMMLNSRNVWSDHRLTEDKRLRCFAQIAFVNFFYPQPLKTNEFQNKIGGCKYED